MTITQMNEWVQNVNWQSMLACINVQTMALGMPVHSLYIVHRFGIPPSERHIILDKIQHRATKHILNDFTCDYRSHLIALKILPLMMQLELYNAMFFIRSLKGPTDAFNIDDHGSTRSSTHLKLKHVLSRTNSARHFYFNRIPRLGNSLPTIYLDQSTGSIKLRVQWFLWDHFICT